MHRTILQLHSEVDDWSNDINEDEVFEIAPEYIDYIGKIDDVESEVKAAYEQYKIEKKDGVTGYVVDIDYILQSTWNSITLYIRHARPAMLRLLRAAKSEKVPEDTGDTPFMDAFRIKESVDPQVAFIIDGELMNIYDLYDALVLWKRNGVKTIAITSAFDYHY